MGNQCSVMAQKSMTPPNDIYTCVTVRTVSRETFACVEKKRRRRKVNNCSGEEFDAPVVRLNLGAYIDI